MLDPQRPISQAVQCVSVDRRVRLHLEMHGLLTPLFRQGQQMVALVAVAAAEVAAVVLERNADIRRHGGG